MNHQTTLEHIGRMTLALLNARDFVRSPSAIWFNVSIMGERGKFRIEVSLRNDLYDVKVTQFRKHGLEYRVVYQTGGIFAENLRSVVSAISNGRVLDRKAVWKAL